ncbi:MAG: UDP-N-acetylenolpyruvoylglucosamine reductase [Nitrospinae bacterium CG11_big_fil_rev_8_21_14_0_20_56_8]|nr:MAG: UDP-N-acetylenolpyruvoylglucosamine reductase [Nitrospinae bacterium CG11_big_fil_rev_8_21_14_0_20_56_8]
MLSEPLKRRLISLARHGAALNTSHFVRPGVQKTVLGRKIYPRATMKPSYHWLKNIKGEVRLDELMSRHTSLRIGGPADVFILPKDIEDLQTIQKHRGDSPVFILGEGTNLLVRDRGIRGIVVSLKDAFKEIKRPLFFKTIDGTEKAVIKAQAGAKMSYLAKFAARYSLTGIEHLVGIPGSLGGALIMNAGAEGTEIGQVTRSISRINQRGEVESIPREKLTFEYRKTVFPAGEGIVFEAELELEKGDSFAIRSKMDDHLSRRSAKQPLTIPNAGSIFKNPEGDAAGRLIEAAGLKGASFGDATVSLRHANFIVNKGQARAQDVLMLMEHIEAGVKEKFGIDLQRELVIIGD